MKYLIVVAHPDDEALGAGATMHKLSRQGHEVYVCVMNSVSDIRCKDSEQMMNEMELSHKILGVRKSFVGNFETMHFNVTPEEELVKFIENAIKEVEPDVVITHHPSDLHNDHFHVSNACRTAVRLSQRQIAIINRVKAFYYMEIPSSTDWAQNGTKHPFIPDSYSEIGEEDLEAKIKSLKVYTEGAVIRDMPHSRSELSLRAYSIKRGTEIGYNMAEGFELVFQGDI